MSFRSFFPELARGLAFHRREIAQQRLGVLEHEGPRARLRRPCDSLREWARRSPSASRPSSAARIALVASRTRSLVHGSSAASSKSFTPQAWRPSSSRQVPKFSIWVSPIERILAASGDARLDRGEMVRPAIEGAAQERERRRLDLLALLGEPRVVDLAVLGEPSLVASGGVRKAVPRYPSRGPPRIGASQRRNR